MASADEQHWASRESHWTERRVTPQRSELAFTSLRSPRGRPQQDAGAQPGAGEHWLVVAHQWVGKLADGSEATHLEGSKHLLAFRKPGWAGWSTQESGHTSARLRAIMALEELLADLRDRADDGLEDPIDDGALFGLLELPGVEPGRTAAPDARKAARRRAGVRKEKAKVSNGRRATTRPNRLTSRARPRRRPIVATPARRPSRR